MFVLHCSRFLFAAAAFKAGKIQNNPFGAGGPGAPGPGGAMIPPPASLAGAGGKAPASSKSQLFYSKTCFERPLKFSMKIGRKMQVALQKRGKINMKSVEFYES